MTQQQMRLVLDMTVVDEVSTRYDTIVDEVSTRYDTVLLDEVSTRYDSR